jgi:alpha-galactosidase
MISRRVIGSIVAGIAGTLLLASRCIGADSYAMSDFESLDKVDVHVHLNSQDSVLIDEAARSGFRLITINVDYPDFPALAVQRKVALAQVSQHPARVAFAGAFSSRGWNEPGWQQRAIREVDDAFDHGAVAIKVWKNIGMALRGADGRLVMVDDAKLDPIFEHIRERGKVLIGHQGEPRNCWLPLEQMTVKGDKEYFQEHPQYYMYLHPEMPSYEAQMTARDRMLAKHPDLRFMGAHMASLEWSVEKLAKFLDAHPHAVVDVAARIGQVQYQSNRDREGVRNFFIHYQDRILYGTDLTEAPGAKPDEMRREAHETWLNDWRYFNTDLEFSVPDLDAPVRGLALPKEVVRKLYADNARRWFGDPWSKARTSAVPAATVEGGGLRIEYDASLKSRVLAVEDGKSIEIGPYTSSEVLETSQGTIGDFAFDAHNEESVDDDLGHGTRHKLTGRHGALSKSVEVTFYDKLPQLAVIRTTYSNRDSRPVEIRGWTNSAYAITPRGDDGQLWSYQSASYEPRPDWVLPVVPGFQRGNFQGMNASDYGGGTPIVDIWRRDIGIAVGHLELVPKLVSLPVARAGKDEATLAVHFKERRRLAPNESYTTFRTFVSVHRGDYFRTLRTYRAAMLRQGVEMPKSPPSAFEPIWCAWGYGREFSAAQIEATLPVARRLGFGWVTLDDGWQRSVGDWTANPRKYPQGDAEIKALVDTIHASGMKAQLWWSPLSLDPSREEQRSRLGELLLNADHSPRKVSWWNTDYQCPAYGPVREDADAFVHKALNDWGFDGLKIDGQHLNAAPRCFNPAHHHARPEDAVEGVPGFFESIFRTARQSRPDAVVEICPCGTAYSFYTMPFLNMTVASDPESSWQVRHKGKTLKALTGDEIAYFGDHVEMSDGGDDFASTLGVGGVVGSNFVWPGAPGKKDPKVLLTPERERAWARWVELYQTLRLSQGHYLGELYDIGFDRPEAHAIAKGERLYYAFFAPQFQGTVELRGLAAKQYRVRDYEAGRDLGVVTGPTARLTGDFQKHWLLEAIPSN